MKEKKNSKTTKDTTKNNIDIKKIIIFVIIGLIIIGLGIFLIIKFGSNEKEVTLNKQINIDIGGYKQVVRAKSIIKNVTIDEAKYVKIYLEIENKKNVESITALHQFKLVDKGDVEVTPCYHKGVLSDSSFDDTFPNTIAANKVTSGYLYCPTQSNDISKLKITVISGGNIDNKNNITYEYKDYYLDLK